MAGKDHISNILLRIRGDAHEGENAIDTIRRRLAELGGQETVAEAEVRIKGEEKLEAVKAALRDLDRDNSKAKIDLDTRNATRKLEALKANLDSLIDKRLQPPDDPNTEKRNSMLASLAKAKAELDKLDKQDYKATFEVDQAKLEASIAQAQKRLDKVSNRRDQKGRFRVIDQDSVASAEASLNKLQDQLRVLRTEDPKIRLDVQIAKALTDIARIEAALAAIPDKEKLNIEVDAKIAGAVAEIEALELQLKVLTAKRRKIDVDVDVDKNNRLGALNRKLSEAGRLGGSLGAIFGAVGGNASKLGQALGKVTVNFGAFGAKLGPAVAVVLVLALALGTTLVAALGLLVSALGAAAVAIGGLATAFAAALGPAVALAVATFVRLAQIIKIASDLEKARDAASRKTVAGTKAAAAEENKRRDALQAVSNALRGVAGAERGLQNAREAARKAISDANKAQADAARDLADANDNLKTTTVDAYAAMKQAALDVTDALLGVEDARLGIDRAALSTQKAELALSKLRGEAGLAGKAFNDLFKKTTDIESNVSVSGLASSFTGGGSSKEDALNLADAVLSVREAKLREKQANVDLTKSENGLRDARKTQADFAKKGIAAFKPYEDALRRQKDATVKLGDATKYANDLEKKGVDQSDGVLSAKDALIDAEQRLKAARADQKTAADGGIADDLAKAQQAVDKLPVGMQRFVGEIIGAKKVLQGFFDPAVNSIFNGLADGIDAVKKASPLLAGLLQRAFNGFGAQIGSDITDTLKSLSSPGTLTFFIDLTNAAGQLFHILSSKVFKGFGKIVQNIATAVMPLLIDAFGAFGDLLLGLGDKTSNIEKVRAFFTTMYDTLGKVLDLIGAVAALFGAFLVSTNSDANGFIDWLTRAVNAFKAFIQDSGNQQAIREFFSDILPLAKQVSIFIILFIQVLLRVLQIFAPFLTGIFTALNFVLGIIDGLLGKLTGFLQFVVGLAAIFFGGPKSLYSSVRRAFLAIAGFLGLKGTLEDVGGFIADLAGLFTNLLGGAIEGIYNQLVALPGRLIGLLSSFKDLGFKIAKAILDGIGDIGTSVFNKIKDKLPLGAGKLLGGSSAPKASPVPDTPVTPEEKAAAQRRFKELFGAVAVSNAVMPTATKKQLSSADQQRGGTYIEKQDVILPPAPGHDQLGDPSDQAQKLADEMARRGRG